MLITEGGPGGVLLGGWVLQGGRCCSLEPGTTVGGGGLGREGDGKLFWTMWKELLPGPPGGEEASQGCLENELRGGSCLETWRPVTQKEVEKTRGPETV